jgi:hypothetical protein
MGDQNYRPRRPRLASETVLTTGLLRTFYWMHVTTPGAHELAYTQEGGTRVILDGLDITSLSSGTPLTGGVVDYVIQLQLHTAPQQPIPDNVELLGATRTNYIFRFTPTASTLAAFRSTDPTSVVAVANIPDPIGHWFVFQLYSDGRVYIFNSLNSTKQAAEKRLLVVARAIANAFASAYPRWAAAASRLQPAALHCLQQPIGMDCGLYAGANAVSLATTDAPATREALPSRETVVLALLDALRSHERTINDPTTVPVALVQFEAK